MTGRPGSTSSAWAGAPCGLLVVGLDGAVRQANATLAAWTGRPVEQLSAGVRLPDLLTVAGRMYWETHLGPLLRVEGGFQEVALDLVTAGGRLPVLVSAARVQDDPEAVSVSVTAVHERRRYEQDLLTTRRAAEGAAGRLAALQAVTAALSSASGAQGVADALVGAVCGHLPVEAAAVWLSDRGASPVLAVRRGGDWGPLPPEPAVGVLVVDLPGQAGVHGSLALVPSSAAGADALAPDVVAAVAAQAGTALERAELFDRSNDVALRLQRSLLAGDVPRDDRFTVSTVYRPGVDTLEVGGDWYDVFRVPGTGRLAVVVGDVVGRGLEAASAMGQLRSAVRAVASADAGPAQVLRRLDAFAEQVPAAGMATLAYAELDLDSGLLVWACAGHPPPVVLEPEEEPRLLWGGRSTPLAAMGQPAQRPEAAATLPVGAALLLYTDGLVERRDRGLDDSLERVRAGAAALLDAPDGELPGGTVEELTTSLLADERTRDDVCVLLLRWHGDGCGPPLSRDLPADLAVLSDVRRDLRSWLAERAAPEQVREDLVLAASEAVANAAQHGAGGRPGATVQVRARLEQDGADALATVTVRDPGRWQGPRGADDERGRGLRIMRALVGEVRIERGDGTTVELRQRWRARAS